jgi:2-polyprenyl-6-hydroxyphenyl methylase/3-demethylubiquinone-9 3-methyltransferase
VRALRSSGRSRLDAGVHAYFTRSGTVAGWWQPDDGPLRFHYEAELAVVERHVPIAAGTRVLDLGTGYGRFGLRCAERGARVTGIDLNVDMVAAARARAQARGVDARFEVRHGDAGDLSAFPPASFDVVLCMELFDHLPAPERVLSAVRRVLAPGGLFGFTYVPGESLYGLLGNAYRWWGRRTGTPIISRTYRLSEVRRLLRAEGLHLERFWGIGLLCLTAQTRLFQDRALFRGLTALARWESSRRPHYGAPWLARHASHVVAVARAAGDT